MRVARVLVLAVLCTLSVASPSFAAARTVSARGTTVVPCHRGPALGAAGRDSFRVTAPSRSIVSVALSSAGDWDLAIFGAKGRVAAASAGFAGNELAEGFVRKGEGLTVQACRYRGDAATAKVSVHFTAIAKKKIAGKVQVVDVITRQQADKQRLQGLGLDLTEHGDANSVEVVLYGRRDARTLDRAGFRYRVRIADLAARTRRNQAKDRRFAAAAATSALPSGRDTYRHLADYDFEMKQLAQQYPLLVKPLTLKYKSVLGRDMNGIEITTNAANTQDGKPIFLNMGVHHAREWPRRSTRWSSHTTCCATTASTAARRRSCSRRARSFCRW